jgi:hypothetical protein
MESALNSDLKIVANEEKGEVKKKQMDPEYVRRVMNLLKVK